MFEHRRVYSAHSQGGGRFESLSSCISPDMLLFLLSPSLVHMVCGAQVVAAVAKALAAAGAAGPKHGVAVRLWAHLGMPLQVRASRSHSGLDGGSTVFPCGPLLLST